MLPKMKSTGYSCDRDVDLARLGIGWWRNEMVEHDNAQSVEKVKNVEFELENACCDVELMKKVLKKMNVDWRNREGDAGGMWV